MRSSPHLAVPFRIEAGSAATVEEGSMDELEQNVRVLIGTRPGERLVVPEFGIEDPTFKTEDVLLEDEIGAAATRWDDRVTVRMATPGPGPTVDRVIEVSRREG